MNDLLKTIGLAILVFSMTSCFNIPDEDMRGIKPECTIQGSYTDGWNAGWKAGWKSIRGQLSNAPLAPLAPRDPAIHKSCQMGYDLGFEYGKIEAKGYY